MAERLRLVEKRPRVAIISDISNEPDDAESLVRYLLYSNEFDTRALVACTSTWLRHAVHPEDMERIIRAYGEVVDNLNKHVHVKNQYSPASYFLDLIRTGPVMYGKEALSPDQPLSSGAKLLLDNLDESSEPLWVLCWGGTNALAQALQYARSKRNPEDLASLIARLRVYAISDQDDTGAWIRAQFPDVFYIVSLHGWCQYGLAAWSGISGDAMYKFDQGGPDSTKISKDWIKSNIQKGPLGQAYPDFMFIPEGDTPTFLYLIQNGLGSPEYPEWGSWGGRYIPSDPSKRHGHFSDTVDRVIGKDGKLHISNQATVWRWRDAYQNDFAARIRWTLTPEVQQANHAPVVLVNGGSAGPEPLLLEAEADSELTLDASETYDPDGDELEFSWFHYKDVTATHWGVDEEVADIKFQSNASDRPNSIVTVRLPPPEKCAIETFSGEPLEKGQVMHLILSVTDLGIPRLTTYKRIVVQITNRELRGRRAPAESIAEVHKLSESRH